MLRSSRLALLLLLLLLPCRVVAEEVAPTGSNFGGVGLIETRNARFREDGVIDAGASLRRDRRFYFLSFQALPFLETTFRTTDRLNGTTGSGRTTDRALDLKLRLLPESDDLPALAIGLQDMIGTGLYGGEYVVASKRWHGFDLSLGLGWGRLGTADDFGNPLDAVSDRFRTRRRAVGNGGTLRTDFFRGDQVAVFGGVEYSLPPVVTPLGVVEGLRAKLEWSGDDLRDERGGYPAQTDNLRGRARSRLNAGLSWSNGSVDAGLSFVHGTDALFRLSFQLNPEAPPEVPRLTPPPPVPAPPAPANRAPPDRNPPTQIPVDQPLSDRTPSDHFPPDRAAAGQAQADAQLAGAVFDALAQAGFRPLSFSLQGGEARLAVAEGRFRTVAQVLGRVVRAVEGLLPPEAQVLRVGWWIAGVEVAAAVAPRETLAEAARGTVSPEEAFAATTLLPATGLLCPGGDCAGEHRAPATTLSYGLEPRLAVILGDPTATLRWQAGLAAGGRLELGSGFALSGAVAQRLAGNLDGGLPSDSRLPHVRSDYARYAAEGKTTIPALYAERIWNVAPDVFGRVTAGLIEPMFGGVGAEVLWRPHDRSWAVGADLNWVRQRAYDGLLGFRRYSVVTGQVSLYADLPVWNLYGIVRAGRYLAGDWGGTVEVGRRFRNGIEVGGFATFTDVSFSRFGEGSFDKGIYLRVPLDIFGPDTRSVAQATIRPVQRDGGQRLSVDNPLWGVTRDGRDEALARGVGGFAR
ncbi:YjbH domain-containing protein [Roseomonas elaeocarpi]|uniref:YjbH domain-containing protein n=1 Tax=Roseomonas elaeocarpi TaxID=907779 RepID=A0ABV6JYW5_9PROT